MGMFLEVATTLGGAGRGASLAAQGVRHVIAVIFGFVLLFSPILSLRPADSPTARQPDRTGHAASA